jgi:ParB-like chromosome segregation protein Spo0J
MSNTPHHSPDFRWEPIDRTKPWDRNPRLNDGAVPKVAASIRRFGFVSPMVVWRSRRQVVAGHTRRKALESILAVDPTFVPKGAPRAGVVPVRYHEFESDAEAAAYAIADNKLNEAAEWDTGELASLMGEIGEMDSELAAVVGSGSGARVG